MDGRPPMYVERHGQSAATIAVSPCAVTTPGVVCGNTSRADEGRHHTWTAGASAMIQSTLRPKGEVVGAEPAQRLEAPHGAGQLGVAPDLQLALVPASPVAHPDLESPVELVDPTLLPSRRGWLSTCA
jgi:hypothetical protein